jgi:antitoxin (DNA-binding transcriptional repressor) of toxin-antitoxin stability system
MKKSTISYLKAHLSAELKAVQEGETVLVMDRSHPVARLAPLEPAQDIAFHPAEKPYDFKTLPALLKSGTDALSPLWDDRRSGR